MYNWKLDRKLKQLLQLELDRGLPNLNKKNKIEYKHFNSLMDLYFCSAQSH